MISDLIVRCFSDATFVFNPKNSRSLFVEGTIADLVPLFLKHPDGQVSKSYISNIQPEHRLKAKEEIILIRKTVKDFLVGLKDNKLLSLETSASSELNETPMKRLLDYAIKRWQIINASIELNNNCNLQCRCCYAESAKKNSLSRNDLQKIAKQLRSAGAVFVLFTGGEIFLRKDVFEILNDFKQHNFALEIKTNGLLLNRTAVDKLANLNLFNLQISIYDTKDCFSEFAGMYYAFNHLLKNINLMVKQKIPVSLSVLVGKHNINDLEKYHDVLRKTEVKEIFYSPYITPQRNNAGKEKNFRLSRKEMDEKFYPFLEKIDGFIHIKKYRDRCKGEPICYAGREQISIDPEGTVFPCLDLRLPMGNLFRDSLNSILKKRKLLLKPYTLEKIDKCWKCGIAEYCDSCIGTSLLEHGNFTEPSQHKCDITHFYHDSNLKRKEATK